MSVLNLDRDEQPVAVDCEPGDRERLVHDGRGDLVAEVEHSDGVVVAVVVGNVVGDADDEIGHEASASVGPGTGYTGDDATVADATDTAGVGSGRVGGPGSRQDLASSTREELARVQRFYQEATKELAVARERCRIAKQNYYDAIRAAVRAHGTYVDGKERAA